MKSSGSYKEKAGGKNKKHWLSDLRVECAGSSFCRPSDTGEMGFANATPATYALGPFLVNATRNCLQFPVSSHCYSGVHPVDDGFPHPTHCSSTGLPSCLSRATISLTFFCPDISSARLCPSPRLSGFLSTHFRLLVTCTETTGIHCGVYSLRFLTVVT